MNKTAPSFPDTVSLIGAELMEAGKKPVSAATHGRLTDLRERLDGVINDFVLCEHCGEMYPFVMQITVGDATAVLCKTCTITAAQQEDIGMGSELRRPTSKRSRAKSARKSTAKQPKEEPEPAPESARAVPAPVADESAPPEAQVDAATDSAAASPEDPSPDLAKDASVATPEEPSPPSEAEPTPEAKSKRPARARTAARPKDTEPDFKATFAEAAKFLGRTTQEVRQVGKFVGEISPPMDVEKTTRYVMAEMRNIKSKSKIPPDDVRRIVAVLKDGIPTPGNGDGGDA